MSLVLLAESGFCVRRCLLVVHLTLSFARAALGLQEMHSQGEARQSLSPLTQVSTAAVKCDSSLSVCALLWVLQDETINSSYKNKAWCIGKAGETERGVKRCYLDGWAGAHITQACQRCGQLAAPVLGERGATARTSDFWTEQKPHLFQQMCWVSWNLLMLTVPYPAPSGPYRTVRHSHPREDLKSCMVHRGLLSTPATLFWVLSWFRVILGACNLKKMGSSARGCGCIPHVGA